MKKNIRTGLLVLIGLCGLLFVSFQVYVSDYYRASDEAIAVLQDHDVTEFDNYVQLLSPNSDSGIIFYPGGKVEYTAYLPLCQLLQESGYNVYLLEMPYNLAFFDIDAANSIIDSHPNIKDWTVIGHSLGGAMASIYAQDYADKIDSLVLLGSYLYGDYYVNNTLTIYGTFNSNLEENIDYTENIVILEGGNHAQFGNYGKQKGDPDATITPDKQQELTVKAILEFIK